MKYFTYEDQAGCHTFSEDEIRKEYYPVWLEKMYKKYDKNYVDTNYCFLDCLDDWIVVNYAWEVKD